ncbi:CU044_5270 family protein [Streptomyces jumonjinensis]|uniref:CU044_5270 family protein n=1 Tax=Streptomyces jumonjinensis TaxID=1945 RepID=A0A646KQR1_STRJU|nr:CU044_5270 family protein [Streptomyces jumonjinensis]MQT04664.1 hypothetical protein [Streptomyces jumonjinensis]
MNREQQERAEIEHAAEVLPPVPCPGPAPERVRVRRHHLLNEIDAQREVKGFGLVLRPRRRMAVMLATVTAAGVAVAALGGLDFSTGDDQDAPSASVASVRLLEKAALAAGAKALPKVTPRGFTYVKIVGHTTVLSENEDSRTERLRESEDMEQWMSVDGSKRTLERKNGKDTLLPGVPGKGNLNAPTYEFLAALPTDPQALIERIYQETESSHGAGSDSTTGPDQEAFVTIGDLLRGSVAPPETAAALYRAAALIPGVVTVPEAVDAAGRHGVAVAREHDGERTEWIFDKSTMRLLGERTVLVKDNAWGKAGSVVTSLALVKNGVVSEAGRSL